jgi:hypothetical protein
MFEIVVLTFIEIFMHKLYSCECGFELNGSRGSIEREAPCKGVAICTEF